MRLTIPLTGTVLVEGDVHGAGDLTGDPNDIIRPIDIDLGNVSWTMVGIDLDAEVMIIEVTPAQEVEEDTGRVDDKGNPVHQRRPATKQEKTGFLQHAQGAMNHTKDELYAQTGNARLKRPLRAQVEELKIPDA